MKKRTTKRKAVAKESELAAFLAQVTAKGERVASACESILNRIELMREQLRSLEGATSDELVEALQVVRRERDVLMARQYALRQFIMGAPPTVLGAFGIQAPHGI